jgi:hypothetical protein
MMSYPIIFPVRIPFAHSTPDQVRQAAEGHGFTLHHVPRQTLLRNTRVRGFSEIWYKLCGRGYAIIRVDTQGHANLLGRDGNANAIGGVGPGPHGSVPHYHKEWIAAEYFQRYLEMYVPQVVRYDDDGDPITGQMTDAKAKATHIKQ